MVKTSILCHSKMHMKTDRTNDTKHRKGRYIFMAVMDEFHEEREAMKHGTPKQKLEYFWLYYKWHVIIAVAAIAAITSFIYETVTRKETALHVLFLNSFVLSEDNGEAYEQNFLESTKINTDEYEILVDTSLYLQPGSMDENTYTALQKVSVYVAAGDVDLLAADQTAFEYYGYLDYLTDLRKMLTPEQIEKYSPYFYYIDGEVLAAKQKATDNLEEYTLAYPDPSKPEEMADPIPVGIFLENASEDFTSNYIFFGNNSSAIGFMINAHHLENAQAFVDYIFATAE